jgi:hypothetical protein
MECGDSSPLFAGLLDGLARQSAPAIPAAPIIFDGLLRGLAGQTPIGAVSLMNRPEAKQSGDESPHSKTIRYRNWTNSFP